jgi:hypothetical protein
MHKSTANPNHHTPHPPDISETNAEVHPVHIRAIVAALAQLVPGHADSIPI